MPFDAMLQEQSYIMGFLTLLFGVVDLEKWSTKIDVF